MAVLRLPQLWRASSHKACMKNLDDALADLLQSDSAFSGGKLCKTAGVSGKEIMLNWKFEWSKMIADKSPSVVVEKIKRFVCLINYLLKNFVCFT